jgi:uncharacterized membrane protein YesL
MTALDRIGAAIICNVLWLLCCLPIITAGAATAALYDTIRRRVLTGSAPIMSTYFKAFKTNFRQGTILGLIGSVIILVVGVGVALDPSHDWRALVVPLVIGAVFAIGVFFWCIPLAVRFTNTTVAHFRHGLLLGLAHLGSTLLLLIGLALVVFGVWQMFPLVFVLPAVLMAGWTYWLEHLFLKHGYVEAAEPEAAAED